MTSPDENSAPSPPTAGLHRVVFLTAGHKGPQFQLQLQQHIASYCSRQKTDTDRVITGTTGTIGATATRACFGSCKHSLTTLATLATSFASVCLV